MLDKRSAAGCCAHLDRNAGHVGRGSICAFARRSVIPHSRYASEKKKMIASKTRVLSGGKRTNLNATEEGES